jgi:hypothetical protein
MMTDTELIEISRGVDSYLSSLLTKYDITPLSIAAVMLARTMLLNKEAGTTEDFLKLISGILANPPLNKTEVNLH